MKICKFLHSVTLSGVKELIPGILDAVKCCTNLHSLYSYSKRPIFIQMMFPGYLVVTHFGLIYTHLTWLIIILAQKVRKFVVKR